MKWSWAITVVTMLLIAIYVSYDNVINGLWPNAILLMLLTLLSLVNYRRSIAEPITRANQDDYQDQHINTALRKCEELEQEIYELKNRVGD